MNILDSLKTLGARERAAVYMRHAERPDFTDPRNTNSVSITERGRDEARRLGTRLAPYGHIRVLHSPILRCGQTARAITQGATEHGATVELVGTEPLIGATFLQQIDEAEKLIWELGREFARRWFDGAYPADIVLPQREVVETQLGVVGRALDELDHGLVLLVTHDWLITALRDHCFGVRYEEVGWPGFLEGVVACPSREGLALASGDLLCDYVTTP